MTSEEYWFWLCNIEGIQKGKIDLLINTFNTPQQIYAATQNRLSMVKGITNQDILNITESKSPDKLREEYEYMKRRGIRFIGRDSDYFPDNLKQIEDAPYGLFVKGNMDLLLQKNNTIKMAIVGARNCSAYGSNIAKNLSFELAAHDITVISGMARGIDSSAHVGALSANGNTIAVLGCGVDVCYPRENINLYEEIAEKGIIISEYPCKTPPLVWHFPMRNRIISGLSDKVIVVEAKEKSGSLITVEYALQQGKDVLAVPGRVSDKLSAGCNRLIREGAELVTNANDILERLFVNENIDNCKFFLKKNIMLEKELESVYSYVDLFPKNIQTISDETGIKPEQLIGLLIQLQMLDLIEEPAKNYYLKKL